MKNLARLGCLARSFVYFIIGLLALLVAIGNPHGATTDTRGALRVIMTQPLGEFMLVLLGVGLLAYAIWRIAQSIQDPDLYGRSIGGSFMRLGFLFSGLAHAFLAFYAFNLIFSFMRISTWGERMMAKWVLMQPLGNFALQLGGAIVVVVGAFQFLRAFDGSYMRDLRTPARNPRTIDAICRFGLLARGVVFVIIGSFFFQAGWKSRSREAGGLHKAWETLHQQPFGNYILGTVAVGFIAFAIFGLIEGFYRKTI